MDIQTLFEELFSLETIDERLQFLAQFYPCLLIYVLRYLGKHSRVDAYMKRFKEVPENPNDVCQHLHRFFLPLLDEMRES